MFSLAGWCATLTLAARLPSSALGETRLCGPDLVSIVVSDAAGASSLADAVYCVGGVFDVEWVGHIELTEVISVMGGTVVNITGAGPDAVADGSSSYRFLNVANATVHVGGMGIENCASSSDGGAIYVEASVVTFDKISFWNNVADGDGGALFVSTNSELSWSGETSLVGNRAGSDGGALHVLSSRVSWSGKTSLSNNTASNGGALYMELSHGSWSGETSFVGNVADSSGGAIEVYEGSTVSWSGNTFFTSNTGGNGGAVYVSFDGNVSWSGDTSYVGNTANVSRGGALFLRQSSHGTWSGDTRFSSNTAVDDGGALFLGESNVYWSGETIFSENVAGFDGGAAFAQDAGDLSWSAATTFLENSCQGSGGAIAVQGDVFITPGAPLVTSFEGNSAGDAGGAVFLSSTSRGPVFVGVNFASNNSSRGGAVYAVSSGTYEETAADKLVTTYQDCLFRNNRASASGGAIESAAGEDQIENTVFKGNTAAVGGALRLGGSVSLTNCFFVENSSDEDAGPAVHNLGILTVEGNYSRFVSNIFLCQPESYLDYRTFSNGSMTRYEVVCDGCPVCDECDVEQAQLVPICSSQIEHTLSEGGQRTVEELKIDRGYWRATNTSLRVLACFNERACRGGLTGAADFCEQGYEGPYCSVCSVDYSTTLSFTCTECVDSDGGITIMIVAAVFVLGGVIVLCMYLVSGGLDGAGKGIIHRLTQRLPLQSIKIVVVVWQILTQFTSVANVTFPDVYQRFLDGVNVLNFDPLWIPSAGCIVNVDFHDRLVMSTIGPLLSLALLAVTLNMAKRRNRGSEAALQKVRHRHVSVALLISFLVYSSVSATIFQTFACEHLDDGKEYLRVDYRIECDSPKHRAFQFYAGIMMLVYPIGIPFFYTSVLYKNRRVLVSKIDREVSLQVQPISDLWVPYKPERFYYEVIECVRRISLTGVVVFIYPNTAAQVAVTLVIAFSFVVVAERLSPYVSKWDASISLIGHIIVFTSMYTALLSKVDVSDEQSASQEVFASILVAAHACMVVVVVAETVVIVLSMRRQKGPVRLEGPRLRVHSKHALPSSEEPAFFLPG
ncbi:unnamed protein product [Ectocarpus sp. 8 AP-2014]